MILRDSIQKALIFYSQFKSNPSKSALARMLGVPLVAIEEEIRQLNIEQIPVRCNVIAREKAMKRLRVAQWLAGCNPFILGIAGANSVALDTVKMTSDVDVVVLTKPGRLYCARLLFALPLLITRLRPGQTEKFPLCASFFIDASRTLADIPLEKDIYFAHWASSLLLYGDSESWQKTLITLQPFMARYSLTLPHEVREMPKKTIVKRILSMLFDYDWTENVMRTIQYWYMPQALKRGGSGIMIGDTIFKAHLDDKRIAVQETFENLCKTRGL